MNSANPIIGLLDLTATKTFGKALLVAAQLTVLPIVLAQDISAPETTSADDVTVEQLAESIRATEAREDIDDATRSRVIEQLRDAEAQVERRTSAEAAAADYAESLNTAPEETIRLRATLDEASVSSTANSLEIDDDVELAELERILANGLAELAAVETRLSDGESQVLSDARVLATQLLLRAETAEMAMLEQEILSHTVRLNLLRAQRDIAADCSRHRANHW